MLKHLSPKTRLSIAGAALLVVALFAVLFFMNRNSNGAPYVPNYPYMPPQTNGQNGEPNETSQVSFKCGEVPTKGAAAPSGWVVKNDPYLCLSVPHPSNWRLITPRNVPLIGQTYPMMLQEVQSGQLERPIATIYPLREPATLAPFISLSTAEIRAGQANIGTPELPIYEFELVEDPASDDKLLQYFLVDMTAMNRTYFIVGYHSKAGSTDADKARVREMVLGLSAY